MRRLVIGLVLVAGGCRGGSAVDHERLGDRAYGAGRYGEAFNEYQAAARTNVRPRVWAKVAAAGLKDARYLAAAEALERLATADPGRRAEAAAGLERVTRVALRADPPDAVAATRAVLALRATTPERPVGLLALQAARSGGLGPSEAIRILPAAIGAAGSGRMVDSLLVALGEAYQLTTACEEAVAILRTALRRGRTATLQARARRGVGACALQLGLDALASEDPVAAETWFDEAIRADTLAETGRRARIGFGDARLRQGDVLGAALAYQRVLGVGVPGDTLVALAEERMQALRVSPPELQEGLLDS